ncbi:MAG: hypothetical protein H7642_06530 [Candidatus Heimdallarchaeota archaeon]|nr:hypothetical protein [Candidatus Heimdallarchaeota archaeon]
MERSIELLNDSGVLGIITPDSHLLGRYYSNIRDYLLANTKILDISLLGFEPFKGATLGRPTISFFRKKISNEEEVNDIFIARWIPTFDTFQKGNWEENLNCQSDFLNYPHNRFHLFFTKEDENYIQEWISKSKQAISDIATIHTGVRSKIKQKNITAKSQKSSTWKRGIISGRQVLPFHIDYQGNWINIDPSKLWSGGFSKEIVENPKIILRQTGYQVVSCVDIKGYYHLNNCHSLSPKDKFTNLYALSVILNSSEFNRVYQILSMEKGRALAQIDIEFLLKMPILTFASSDEEKLEIFYFQQNEIVRKTKKYTDYSLFKIVG